MKNNAPAVYARTLLLLLLLCLYGLTAAAQAAFIRHYTTRDGLPSNNCYYTLQDRQGYLWVATDAGISRFDGNVFETFSVDDGLPDNQIISIYQDRGGRIWFSALNGQLSYFDQGKIFNTGNDPSLKMLRFNGVVLTFFEDRRGHLWFGTNQNLLACWDGHSLKKYTSADPHSKFINSFVFEDQTGRIWVSSTHGLHYLEGNTFKKAGMQFSPLSYKAALGRPGHPLFFLDKKGLNRTDGPKQQLVMKVPENLLADNPGYFYTDQGDELWLAGNSGIFHLLKDGSITHYLHHQGSSQVLRDREGNMWFTTPNGIYMLPVAAERVYTADSRQGLASNHIKSLLRDRQGRIWLGTDNGTINIWSGAARPVRTITIPERSKFSMIKQLSADSAEKYLYFASDYGLGRMNMQQAGQPQISYLKETGNSGFVLKSFSLGADRQIALALSSGVVLLKDREKELSFTTADYREGQNFFSSRAYRVFYDTARQLWFSNTSGLSEFSKGELISRYRQHPLLTRRINDIAQLPDGTLVLATDGYGLLFFKNNRLVRQVRQQDGLGNNICKKLFIRGHNIWVITNTGVNRISADGKSPVESFEYASNLLDSDVNDLYAGRDTVYFATSRGLVYFANKPFNHLREKPSVLISGILINRKPVNPGTRSFTLAPADNSVTFYYSAIDFRQHTLLYRYRLKTNSSWTETKNRKLDFSSLEPGKYQFELSARTGNSEWGKPVKISFTLKEHFWQTTWFTMLTLLAVSFSFYKIAVRVTRQQKDKEQQQLRLKNKILMLEQQSLQAMMNPHFVFNVMNSIQHYINTKDHSSANRILTGFARLIRKNLDICTRSFISLEEEVGYLTLYLGLEKIRFGEKFSYSFHISEAIDQDETMIPSMILQPYIENAIWHGLMPLEEGGTIRISMTLEEDHSLLISITDDGVGIDNALLHRADTHSSKGMSLTRERIQLINQTLTNPIQLSVYQNGKSGTTVSIRLPPEMDLPLTQ